MSPVIAVAIRGLAQQAERRTQEEHRRTSQRPEVTEIPNEQDGLRDVANAEPPGDDSAMNQQSDTEPVAEPEPDD